MTRDEYVRLAREAGDEWETTLREDQEFLIRFAAIVEERAAAAEREACAKVCEANARLIAAAPDLLAELQWMRNHWEPTEGKVGDATLLNAKGDEICEWMARVDSVLARCTPQPAEAIRARGE